MKKSAGYVVQLTSDRESSFEHNNYESFGEPVPEFSHSRNIPLVCFVIDSKSRLTYISLGKRGVRAGTDLRRLNLYDIFSLKAPISIEQIKEKSPNKLKIKISERLDYGGLLPPKSFEAILQIISLSTVAYQVV